MIVHPCHGIPLSSKKEQTTDTCNNLEKSQGNYVERKKSVSEVIYYISCSMYKAFLKQQIRERVEWLPGFREAKSEGNDYGYESVRQEILGKRLFSVLTVVVITQIHRCDRMKYTHT